MSDDKPSSRSGTIRRFAWIVVNVRDLERSRAFYERFTPLRDRSEFEVSDASVFGVERGSFVAAVMRDDTGTTACPVLLVQWSNPPVTGTTYPSHTNPGYFRICFQHPDAGALFAEVRAAGHEPLSPLRLPKPGRSTGRPVFSVRDPDGTVLEFLTFPGAPRLYHVNCNTADLERAHAFFDDTVGLECAVRSTTTDLEEHSFGPGGDLATYDARLYRADDNPGGPPHLLLDVVESTFPGPVGHSYTAPTNAGIARVGVEVDDLGATPAATWELGPLLGARRVAVLRSPDDVPFDLVERVS